MVIKINFNTHSIVNSVRSYNGCQEGSIVNVSCFVFFLFVFFLRNKINMAAMLVIPLLLTISLKMPFSVVMDNVYVTVKIVIVLTNRKRRRLMAVSASVKACKIVFFFVIWNLVIMLRRNCFYLLVLFRWWKR